MTPERFEQIAQLYGAALELAPEERASFIDRACSADEELRREVESLLEANEEAGDFIATPALGMAAELLEGGEAPSLSPGHCISHYQVLSLLGAGGMGEVYLAEDTVLGRKVALKLLPKGFTDNPERVGRFELEARAASALNHPNIITIYEMGRAGGVYFIATEFIDGETLRDQMARARMNLAEAIEVAAQVAGALDVAHGAGVVHRDIKPENVMIRRDGIVKVLDFGLTKLAGLRIADCGLRISEETAGGTNAGTGKSQPRRANPQSAIRNPQFSESGLVLGTVRYMSPEQTRDSAQVDHRTDIWSLGVMLYEMVSERAPFEGEDVHQRIVSIRESEPPPLADCAEGVPARLEEIVRRALAKKPDKRYQTARELLHDLRSLRQSLEVSEEMARSSPLEPAPSVSSAEVIIGEIKRHKRGILLTLAAFTLLTAGAVFWADKWISRDRPSKAAASVLKIIPFTSFPGVEMEPSFSPDGKQIAFSWNGPGGDNFDIYVKSLDTGAPLRLTSHPSEDHFPSWSPDGRHIAFIRYGEHADSIMLVPARGGPERILQSVTPTVFRLPGHCLSWSPDGKLLAFADRDTPLAPSDIYLLSVESRARRRLTAPPAGATHGDGAPAFSPVGDTLAFTRRGSDDKDDIYLVPVSGGEPTRLTSDKAIISGLSWTPDGREIIFSSNRAGARHLWQVAVSGGTPERVPAGEEGFETFAVSRQGRLLAYASTISDSNIWRVEARGRKEVSSNQPLKLISSTWMDNGPQYSPDGKKIAFASSRTGKLEVWMCAADGSNPVQLTFFNGPQVGTPRWSPDGREIVFDSTAAGQRDIYVVGVDGSRPRRLTVEPSLDVRGSWSRDGRFIYFGSNRSGEWQVWKVPAEGGPAVQVTKQGGREAFESLDGRFVYYAKGDVPGLWRVPAEGGEEVKVLDQVRQGAWAVWEQGIYFVNPDARPHLSVEFYSFATHRTTRVAPIAKELFWGAPNLATTGDGRWILYVQVDQTESDIILVENFS
jgi:Tol biopolymer transport system component/predicted Ser/Thr protein kinase